MGGQSSKDRSRGAIGSSINEAENERKNDVEDLPDLPYEKQAAIKEKLKVMVKKSWFGANYKRSIRCYLRQEPELNQQGVFHRIHNFSMEDAGNLGTKKDSFDKTIDECVNKLAGDLLDEIRSDLISSGKLKAKDSKEKQTKEAERILHLIFKEIVNMQIEAVGKKLYDTYSRGLDFEVSEDDLDDKASKVKADERKAKHEKEAATRKAEAEKFKVEAAEARKAEAKRQKLLAAHQKDSDKQRKAQAGDYNNGSEKYNGH